MAIKFEDYLISFNVSFNKNLRRSLTRAANRMRNTPLEIGQRFRSLQIPSLVSGKLPVTLTVKTNLSKKKWNALARQTELLREDLFPAGGESQLGAAVREAMDFVGVNLAERFVNASLDTITGQLADALGSQAPEIEEYQNTGIRAGFMNIQELNEGTQPYFINRKTGEVKPRESAKEYTYRTADGKTIDADGYWAFQEFGTSNGVLPRSFILDVSRELHGEDETIFLFVQNFLSEKISAYSLRALEIMR